MKAELTDDERQELVTLDRYQESRTRWMSQEEFDRLKFLRKVEFMGCRNNCKPEDWSENGMCHKEGCYQSPSIFVLDESENLVQIQ